MRSDSLITEKDGLLYIRGELNFSTVVTIWKDSLALLAQRAELHFDLSQVGSCDSAGLALILEWIKFAKQNKKTIQFSHIPKQLESIVRVSGLQFNFLSFAL